MDGPILNAPFGALTVSDSSDDVAATKDLLSWMREQGFSTDSVKIGRVELVGTRDLFPHPKARVDAAAADDAESRSYSQPSIYREYGADLEFPGSKERA